MEHQRGKQLTDSYEALERQTDELLNSSLKALREQGTDDAPTSANPSIEDQLALAKASRNQAESARQKIANEILTATKEVCQKLITEGEVTLEKAKKLEAGAEQKHLDAQSELQQAQVARSEAETYAEKLRAEAQQQAKETTEQTKALREDADAYVGKARAEAQELVREATGHAQSVREDADAYAEEVAADAERVAAELIESTRSVAEQEANQLKQQAAQESQRTLAEAELTRIAAQEELEAQRIYAETAKVTAESLEVLAQIRAKLAESPESQDTDSAELVPLRNFDPNWQKQGKIEARSPLRETPAPERPTVDVYNNRRNC